MRPTLVLCPALACDQRLWTHQIEGLSDLAEIQVADLTQDDSLTGMAARLLATVPGDFFLAGSSLGGYVAFEVMRQAASRVRGLVLVGTSAAPDDEAKAAGRNEAIAKAQAGGFHEVLEQLLPKLVVDYETNDEKRRLLQEMAQRVGASAFVRQQTAILRRPDSRPLLASLNCPVQLIFGDSDVPTPPVIGETLSQQLPVAELDILPDCGHLATLDQPGDTTRCMREWLLAQLG